MLQRFIIGPISMFFRQVKGKGDNFSYVIADEATGEGVVVDPSYNAELLLELIREHSLNIKYIINTHHHRDHTAGNRELRSNLDSQIVAHELSEVDKDIDVTDGDILQVGSVVIKVIHTPGHSPDSICLLVDNKLLTGDTLFVGECGRTDTRGGSSEDMYNSLFNKIGKLDENIEVFPGHDYGPSPTSTIGKEKKTNYTLEKRTLEEFIEFMRE